MSGTIRTIKEPTESIVRDRGSKFIAYCHPVKTEDDVKLIVKGIWDKHPGICHVCYAYRIGKGGERFRANDDGEPTGSAGLPILNQIKSKGLTDTLVAVARYFGGTKLGVTGLIKAYKLAAKQSIEKATILEKVPTQNLVLRFPHSRIGDVERIIGQNDLKVVSKLFDLDCNWTIEVTEKHFDDIKQMMGTLKNVEIDT